MKHNFSYQLSVSPTEVGGLKFALKPHLLRQNVFRGLLKIPFTKTNYDFINYPFFLLKMLSDFSYFPSPEILDWLALGRLGNRFNRSIRLWVLLKYLYGKTNNLAAKLPNNFSYIDLREEFFSPAHPLSDRLTTEQIKTECRDKNCICKKSVKELIKVEISPQSI